jgi:prepilin-type N-terminal cleavage/methylation domain-containing protein
MRSRNTGFSLIELMITVAIMGILSAVAIPAYQNYITKAKTVDLMTASHMGQLMVAEYIQTTSAPDCTAMPGQAGGAVPIPISSKNIGSAVIDAAGFRGYGNCSVIVSTVSSGLAALGATEQLGWIPEIQMASFESIVVGDNAIPSVQLVAALPIGGPRTTGAPTFVEIYSVPTFNADGSIVWAMSSNGAAGAPASLPTMKGRVFLPKCDINTDPTCVPRPIQCDPSDPTCIARTAN